MIENEELRADIDRYLMERFKYRKSLVCLTVDNVIDTQTDQSVIINCIDKLYNLQEQEIQSSERKERSNKKGNKATFLSILKKRICCKILKKKFQNARKKERI